MITPRARPTILALAIANALASAPARAEIAPAQTAPAPPTTAPAQTVPAPPTTPPAQTAPALPKDDDGPPRLSLPTETDREAWKRPGFRLSLGLTYGHLWGLGGAPGGRLLGPLIRFGIRLDADWSILVSFQYSSASGPGTGLGGLRFAGTIDPTWHATRHLSLALGVGFGGFVDSNPNRADPTPLPSTIASSYTFPNASQPLPSCSGEGVAGLARADWTIVLGSRASTNLGLEAIGQWTGCVDDTGRVELDTGQAIVRRQWWPHVGLTGTWSVMWR